MRIWHFPALAGVFLVVGACNGMSSIGGDDDGTGGEAGDDNGRGGTAGGGGSSMRGGSGGTSGSGNAPGSGGTGRVPEPCAGKPCGAQCYACAPIPNGDDPDMGAAVPCDTAVRFCSAEGECTTQFPTCETQCEQSWECAVPELPCQQCADGSFQCPTGECQMGRCVVTYPTCPTQCMSDAECPLIGAPCQMCPDGTTSCPTSRCLMGQCTTTWPTCGATDPCEGRACGEPCNPTCTEMGCGMNSDVAFSCNAEGQCSAEPPACGAMCMTAMDCPQTDLCFMCPGGTCGNLDCVNGRCQYVCPPVDPPQPECMSAMDCPSDLVCRLCPDMSCAEVACVNGECKSVCPL